MKGPAGLTFLKSPGRKPKLAKSQKKELAAIIEKEPAKAGFPGARWRSPMTQALIYEKFRILFAVNYISQLLKSMGFSFQKAAFTLDRRDAPKREDWLRKKWPAILSEAEKKNALILFGDEASFPQWGTLSYIWARKGRQPVAKTPGVRKAYKVFGLIEYFSGRFFFQNS